MILGPKFEVLGTPPSLLHVSLPASSSIYTRRGSVIGANGNLADMTSKLTIDQPATKLASSLPVVFQKVTATSPITLLLGVKTQEPYYATVPVSREYNWIIAQRKALLGWTGNLSVAPYSRFKLWGNVEISGNQGQVALAGEGGIFQVEVQKDQTFMVNPANVIAYTRLPDDSSRAFVRLPHTNLSLDIPWLKKYTSQIQLPDWAKRTATLLQSWATKLLWRDDIALKVSGPRTLLIQTKGTNLQNVLDKKELNDILKGQ